MVKKISLLGSTGSIGRNVLDVIRHFPEHFKVEGLAAGRNIVLLREQIEEFRPALVSVADETLAAELAENLPAGWNGDLVAGEDGSVQVATLANSDMVVSAIVGAAGLLPTLAAVRAGKDIALANKETLVMAGNLVMDEVRRHNVRLLPIDSEHSAVAQALAAGRKEDVARIILTASGGPFLGKSARELMAVSPAQALKHPNWEMGRKITIDSATLMNKGLEVIEARWLFDIDVDRIEVLVHPQSIVHSMVEFIDGSVVAQMGVPDMRIPIVYALSYPARRQGKLPRLNLAECRDLSFQLPDLERFPALKLAYEACREGGTMPAVLNAANEVAVEAYLAEKIRFPEIVELVAETLSRVPRRAATDIETVLDADLQARTVTKLIIGQSGNSDINFVGESVAGLE